MTSLGHTLVGASIGLYCMPLLRTLRHRFLFLVAMIAVANLPDWPIPGWGHFRLEVSHSIIVNGGLMLAMAVILSWRLGPIYRNHRIVVIGVAAAWMSHLFLDTLYADSRLAAFWPVSKASVSLPVPWLQTLPHLPPPLDGQVLSVLLYEALTFLPLLALAGFMRMGKGAASGQIDPKH